MTCIVWDGRVLAGDRLRLDDNNSAPNLVRKVWLVRAPNGRRYLVGCAGDSYDCVAFVRWLKYQRPGDKPAPTHFGALVIDEKLRVWSVNHKLVYVELTAKYAAIGCGYQFALGALACGADAVKAVRIAARFDAHVGGGVNVVRFT